MDARTFFEEALPDLVKSRGLVFDRAAGRVCVVVNGAGAWTLTFGDHRAEEAVVEKLDFDADLVVTWSEAQFADLLAGEPDPEKSKPVFLGDPRLLTHLGHLLMPPARGGLGARLMSS